MQVGDAYFFSLEIEITVYFNILLLGNVFLYQSNKNVHPPSNVFSVSVVADWSSSVMASLVYSCDGSDLCLMSCKNNFRVLYALVLPIFNRSCIVNCDNVFPIAKSFSSTAMLVATNSSPGRLFPLTGKYTITFWNCFPSPTVIPWLLCIESALHTCSGIAVIEQHFFSHCRFTSGIGTYVGGIFGINFCSSGTVESGKSTTTYILSSGVPSGLLKHKSLITPTDPFISLNSTMKFSNSITFAPTQRILQSGKLHSLMHRFFPILLHVFICASYLAIGAFKLFLIYSRLIAFAPFHVGTKCIPSDRKCYFSSIVLHNLLVVHHPRCLS